MGCHGDPGPPAGYQGFFPASGMGMPQPSGAAGTYSSFWGSSLDTTGGWSLDTQQLNPPICAMHTGGIFALALLAGYIWAMVLSVSGTLLSRYWPSAPRTQAVERPFAYIMVRIQTRCFVSRMLSMRKCGALLRFSLDLKC